MFVYPIFRVVDCTLFVYFRVYMYLRTNSLAISIVTLGHYVLKQSYILFLL